MPSFFMLALKYSCLKSPLDSPFCKGGRGKNKIKIICVQNDVKIKILNLWSKQALK